MSFQTGILTPGSWLVWLGVPNTKGDRSIDSIQWVVFPTIQQLNLLVVVESISQKINILVDLALNELKNYI
ncbi:hypothetical protein [Umezakia ovalisporum]|uniref:Uncharacterized protein n=1 Tax=Umezakia ovalisporum FSS-62 TaxID=2971776 RepID=A0AA43GX74_9CYAN|nr:hypothetical protein [Umezakia ovalisporum]MDH6063307.1 hypothetical protein [Umezakia ovalisporum FSS-62]